MVKAPNVIVFEAPAVKVAPLFVDVDTVREFDAPMVKVALFENVLQEMLFALVVKVPPLLFEKEPAQLSAPVCERLFTLLWEK